MKITYCPKIEHSWLRNYVVEFTEDEFADALMSFSPSERKTITKAFDMSVASGISALALIATMVEERSRLREMEELQ